MGVMLNFCVLSQRYFSGACFFFWVRCDIFLDNEDLIIVGFAVCRAKADQVVEFYAQGGEELQKGKEHKSTEMYVIT